MLLKDKIVFITGGSRGIGREIALRFARDGAKIAIAAKSDKPHPKLPGTIYTVATEIEEAGGTALPLKVDVRDEGSVQAAIDKTVSEFGALDILVNNASAISPAGLLETPPSRYDLLQTINTRGTYICGHFAVPYLKNAQNPHILTLSPPLNIQPHWYGKMLAYAISKYGMSMCTLGFSEEFRADGIAANSLWPKTFIATDAVRVFYPDMVSKSRSPAIMADAAYAIVTKDSKTYTGQCLIDEDVLTADGIKDLSKYSVDPAESLEADILI